MMTLHRDDERDAYTFRCGNHIGRIFQAETTAEFENALVQFRQDLGETPYPQTDDAAELSPQSRRYINAAGKRGRAPELDPRKQRPIRWTDPEWDEVRQSAEELGQTPSEFVRRTVLRAIRGG